MNKEILVKGFIPEEICTRLPNDFEDVEEISFSLNKTLANNQIGNVINQLPPEKDISSLSVSELERAMLLYSYIGTKFLKSLIDLRFCLMHHML